MDQPSVLLYIDPGVGFLALQILAGSVLGISFFFRRTTARVLKFLRINGKKDSKKSDKVE